MIDIESQNLVSDLAKHRIVKLEKTELQAFPTLVEMLYASLL